jgi:hypothetical protein
VARSEYQCQQEILTMCAPNGPAYSHERNRGSRSGGDCRAHGHATCSRPSRARKSTNPCGEVTTSVNLSCNMAFYIDLNESARRERDNPAVATESERRVAKKWQWKIVWTTQNRAAELETTVVRQSKSHAICTIVSYATMVSAYDIAQTRVLHREHCISSVSLRWQRRYRRCIAPKLVIPCCQGRTSRGCSSLTCMCSREASRRSGGAVTRSPCRAAGRLITKEADGEPRQRHTQ